MKREFLTIDRIDGPLVMLSGIQGAFFGELIEIELASGEKRLAKIISLDGEAIVAQVFEGTSGLSAKGATVRLTGKPLTLSLSEEMLGRVFDGLGRPIDGSGTLYGEKEADVNGRPMNPVSRLYPRNYIHTGISAIDLMMTLIRGQKLPIFSGSGLPHNQLAAQIVRQADIAGEDTPFAVVFAAIGVKHDESLFFTEAFEESGVIDRVVMFLNRADDPIVERVSTPRVALTAAEHLAFDKGYHVLVVMSDLTAYCEALREVASAREEVPSRKGYPGYLYSDLASLYERAGMLKDRPGSITFLPILTMPGDDITHPIPDLTGYITEGQIVLSRGLHQRGIYPPVDVLPSLSRLMKDGIGEGYTREDHPDLSNQLFALYAKVQRIRGLAQIVGEADLSDMDRAHMDFGRRFEAELLGQDQDEARTMEETLEIGWRLVEEMPIASLDRLSDERLEERGITP